MVLPRFVSRALSGEDLLVYGDGQQSRCFCHVSDVVEALARLMECPAARGEVVNIGTTDEISILALAERVIERTGSASEIRFIPYQKVYGEGFEDMRRRIPCLQKISRLIGWRPLRSINDIVDDVIAGMEARRLVCQ